MKDLLLKLVISAKDRASSAVRGLVSNIRSIGTSSKASGDAAAESIDTIGDKAKGVTGRLGALGVALKGFVAGAIGKAFVDSNRQLEGMQLGLELITGSAEAAAAEMAFVRDEAQRLGIDVLPATKAFLDLSAAAKGTALEGEGTREIFSAIAQAMGRLGKSAYDTEGALQAVQQMISKGKVSAEELRGQLGERLPGAFQAAARAMGVTTAELDKMLQNGELIAEDLLPKLAAELNKTFDAGGRVESFSASWARFKNTLVEAANSANEATGIMDGLAGSLDFLGKVVQFVSVGFTTVVEYIKATTAALGDFFDFISGDQKFTEFKKNASDAFDQAGRAIADAADRTFTLEAGIEKAGDEAVATGGKIKAAAETAKVAIEKQTDLFASLAKAIGESTPEEVKKFAATVDALGESGALTAEQFKVLKASIESVKGSAKDTGDEFERLSALIERGFSVRSAWELDKAYREGKISLQEFYDLTQDLIGKFQEERRAIDDVSDGLGDLGEAGAEAGAKVEAGMNRATAAAGQLSDQAALAKANISAMDRELGIAFRTAGTPIPDAIQRRYEWLVKHSGIDEAEAFINAAVQLIGAGVTDTQKLLRLAERELTRAGDAVKAALPTPVPGVVPGVQPPISGGPLPADRAPGSAIGDNRVFSLLKQIADRPINVQIDGHTAWTALQDQEALRR